MTHLKLVRPRPARRSAVPLTQQDNLSKALGLPSGKRRLPIRLPFSLANPMINAPQRIAPALLQPFMEQCKLLRLVHPEFRSLSAKLITFDEHALQAMVREPIDLLPYLHQRLFVVFPVLLQQSYVLAASIEAVAAERVTLRYHDPRMDSRYDVPVVGPLAVQLAQPSVLDAMEREHMRLTRELVWRPGGAANGIEGELVDRVEDQPGAADTFVDFFSAAPVWQGELHDLSRGGACLILPLDLGGQAAINQVVSLCLRLPPVKVAATQERVSLTLRVLGIVRAVRGLRTGVVLHVQFLDRLPEAMGGLLAQLACDASFPPAQGGDASG